LRRRTAALAALIALSALTGSPFGQESDPAGKTPAGWPKIALVRAAGPFDQPAHLTNARDRSGRLFVVEQKGRILVVKDGSALSVPFLDITGRVSCCEGRGLMSAAFPYDYVDKRQFYVDYTDRNGDTVIARYKVTSNPDVADPNSEQILLTVKQPGPGSSGGQIAFGVDGYLYAGVGDGGPPGKPESRAQDPASLLGKILRIDPGPRTAPYGIPPDNPFVKKEGYRPEVWALGLRNPRRFSIDSRTGDIYIGDAGQDRTEEIDVQPGTSLGGQNYGWNVLEGSRCHGSADCRKEGFILPVAEYDRSGGCSVTGGLVYRGEAHPDLQGIYLYGDLCSGRIWGLRKEGEVWKGKLLTESKLAISTFGEDEAGNLYVADHGEGGIFRIEVAKEKGRSP